MSRHIRKLLYPLGVVVIGAVQWLGTELENEMDLTAQRNDEAIASGYDIVNRRQQSECPPKDAVTAVWKGVAGWTALYGLVRLGLRRPATVKRYSKAFLKSSAAFNVGLIGTAFPLGRSFGPHHDDGDAAFVGSVGLAGGVVSLTMYHLFRWTRRKPAAAM